jgi:hypothetical protein
MTTWSECEEITNRWENTGLLAYAEDKKTTLALVLEGQRRFNNENHHNMHPQFMRLSIPLWVRIINQLSEGQVGTSPTPLTDWIYLETRFHQSVDNYNKEAEILMCAELADQIVTELKKIEKPIVVHAMNVEPDGFVHRIKINYEYC